jgi:hypothetical protein
LQHLGGSCEHLQEQENEVVEESEGGDGRDPTPKNMAKLMPAEKFNFCNKN